MKIKSIICLMLVALFVGTGYSVDTSKTYGDEVDIVYPGKTTNNKKMVEIKTRIKLPNKNANKIKSVKGVKKQTDEFKLAILSLGSAIELPSVINDEFILETGNTYHASTDVTVASGAILKHRPGAVIEWAQDTGLFIDPNGVYIARGKPDAMCIHIPDTDSNEPDYWKGIKLTGGSPFVSLSELNFVYISCAQDAVTLSDITLNKSLENCFLEFNSRAIISFGPRQTKISNNVCYWNEIGISVDPDSELGMPGDPNNVIEVVGNTCHENGVGMVFYGSYGDIGIPTIFERNVSTASEYFNYWYGNGPIDALFLDNGRWLKYAGSQDANYNVTAAEYNPILVQEDPFLPGPGYYDIVRLNQNSWFVDGAYSIVWDFPYAGYTTSNDDNPDKGYCDLGYHYPAWSFVNTGNLSLKCDFDDDYLVGLSDLEMLSEFWLREYTNPIVDPNADPNLFSGSAHLDTNNDGFIDLQDYVSLAKEWLLSRGVGPEIFATITDGEYGEKVVSVTGYDDNTHRIFLFVDGSFIKEIFLQSEVTPTRRIFIPWMTPGVHEAKIVSFDIESNVICGTLQEFTVDSSITECMAASLYKKKSPLPFSAKSTSGVRVSAWVNGAEIWGEVYPGGSLNGFVPGSVTDGNDIEFLKMDPIVLDSTLATLNSSSGSTVIQTGSADDNYDGYTALLIRPDGEINWVSGLSGFVYDKLVEMGYKTKKLHSLNSTFKRVKKIIDNNKIKVVYYDGHSNFKWGGVLRSCQEFDDCVMVSDKVSRYNPGQAPSWLDPFPAKIEASVKTWAELDLDDLKFAAFDACYPMRLKINGQGKLEECLVNFTNVKSDLTAALLQRGEYVSQFVFGWADYFVGGTFSPYQSFSIELWDRLSKGDDLAIAISKAHGSAPENVQNEHRLQGNGNSFDFKL